MHLAFYLKCIIKMEQAILKYSIGTPPMSIRHLFSYQTVGMNVHYRNFHLYIKPLYQIKILRLNVAYHFCQWHMKKLILKDMAPVSCIRIYSANSSTNYGLMFRGFPLTTFIESEMNCVFLLQAILQYHAMFSPVFWSSLLPGNIGFEKENPKCILRCST